MGERYNDPPRYVFDEFATDHPINRIDPGVALRRAVKAFNDTAGPDGLVPFLLLFTSV